MQTRAAMTRSRTILASLKLANSLVSTHPSSIRKFDSQVTQFSYLSLYNRLSIPKESSSWLSFDSHTKHHFSSKPSSIVQLLLAKNWSDELECELETSTQSMRHETCTYVLRKLDKDPKKAFYFFNWVCDKNWVKPSSSLYSIVLRILGQKETMKPFWITLRKMKENGFYIDEETYITISGVFKKQKMTSDAVAFKHFYGRMVKDNAMDDVAKKVVDLVVRSEWSGEVETELAKMEIALCDNFVIRVLKELRKEPVKALNFFHWVSSCSTYQHNTVTYNAALRVLARDASITEFWSVLEEMKSAGHDMDIDTYIKISRQFQKWKMMVEAVKLYEFMMDGQYKPSVQDCSMLLRSLAGGETPNLDLVFRVVGKYESTGETLSKAVYDGIHRALTSAGRFDEAENIVEAMIKTGCKPDNITYSQLVFGLCKAKRLEDACKVLDTMEEQGCVPDIKTWTILIQGHCDANELDNALLCFAKMMEKHLDVDPDLVDVLVNGFIHQNRVDGANTLLVEMIKQARLRPWQATYKNVIEKLLGIRKFEEALNLLLLMKQQNYPPYPEPFDKYISKHGTVNDGVEFLKVMSLRETPSFSAYVKLFESFFEEGRHSEAKDLLYKCPHHIRKHPKISELFGSANSVSSAA